MYKKIHLVKTFIPMNVKMQSEKEEVKHVCVVGAGIAGLYTAYTLAQTGRHKVIVVESASRVGGRIHTVRIDQESFDVGAGRFNENHTLLMKLITELGFDDKMVPLRKQKTYRKDASNTRFNPDTYIKKVIDVSQHVSAHYLRQISLKLYMKLLFPDSVVDDIIYSFGYSTEFERINAYDALHMMRTDFLEEIQYFTLMGGLGIICEELLRRLRELGCDVRLGTKVTKYVYRDADKGQSFADALAKPCTLYLESQYEKETSKTHAVVHCDTVVFCVPKDALRGIRGVVEKDSKLQQALDNIGICSLMRIFAKFPKDPLQNRVWFHDVPRTTTNNFIRYMIPLNKDSGTIMISYSDGYYADSWNAIKKKKEHIMEHVRKMFPDRTIPDPVWTRAFYWKTGTHYWKPSGAATYIKYKNTKDALDTHGYCVCGEAVSRFHHGWIEGALISAKEALDCVVPR